MTYDPVMNEDGSHASNDGPTIIVTKKIVCWGCQNLLSETYEPEPESYAERYICRLTPPSALVREEGKQDLYAPNIYPEKTPEWCMRRRDAEWKKLREDLDEHKDGR